MLADKLGIAREKAPIFDIELVIVALPSLNTFCVEASCRMCPSDCLASNPAWSTFGKLAFADVHLSLANGASIRAKRSRAPPPPGGTTGRWMLSDRSRPRQTWQTWTHLVLTASPSSCVVRRHRDTLTPSAAQGKPNSPNRSEEVLRLHLEHQSQRVLERPAAQHEERRSQRRHHEHPEQREL